MALQVPLANDKKRVKVYELRDNDWFDRGTGFCTGQIINVRNISQVAAMEIARHFEMRSSLLCLPAFCLTALILFSNRMNHVFTSSQKISRRGCCWKQKLSRTMDIRSNK